MKTYIIKPGKHFPKWPPYSFRGPVLRFGKRSVTVEYTVVFGVMTEYHLGNHNQKDWNKFPGIVWGLNPQKFSARFGWRYLPESGTWEIGYYVHDGDKQAIYPEVANKHVLECHRGLPYRLKIVDDGEAYHFYVQGKHYHTVSKQQKTPWYGYRVGPYFGGDEVAPTELWVIADKNMDWKELVNLDKQWMTHTRNLNANRTS
ncbi:hypothetical protein AAG747_15375 [Rapidithrix thailandica]|uniref:Uncharacterized protein n=1 Tax=Rapidithrix thailandica TaxID=413964 RepID=A0AAW9SAG7_9BACT